MNPSVKAIREKYPDRVPILLKKGDNNSEIVLDKPKYICPSTLIFSEFVHVIRKRMQLKPEKALFFYIDNMLPSMSDTLYELYDKHKNSDGLLYITICEENTFG